MTDSLLSRLQALTGPDREIDAEIALANGWTNNPNEPSPYQWRDPGGAFFMAPPRYTESLDAVIPLTPKKDGRGRGLWIRLNQFGGSHGFGNDCWHAELYGIEDEDEFKYYGLHTNLAIALLIAIMKARAAGIDTESGT